MPAEASNDVPTDLAVAPSGVYLAITDEERVRIFETTNLKEKWVVDLRSCHHVQWSKASSLTAICGDGMFDLDVEHKRALLLLPPATSSEIISYDRDDGRFAILLRNIRSSQDRVGKAEQPGPRVACQIDGSPGEAQIIGDCADDLRMFSSDGERVGGGDRASIYPGDDKEVFSLLIMDGHGRQVSRDIVAQYPRQLMPIVPLLITNAEGAPRLLVGERFVDQQDSSQDGIIPRSIGRVDVKSQLSSDGKRVAWLAEPKLRFQPAKWHLSNDAAQGESDRLVISQTDGTASTEIPLRDASRDSKFMGGLAELREPRPIWLPGDRNILLALRGRLWEIDAVHRSAELLLEDYTNYVFDLKQLSQKYTLLSVGDRKRGYAGIILYDHIAKRPILRCVQPQTPIQGLQASIGGTRIQAFYISESIDRPSSVQAQMIDLEKQHCLAVRRVGSLAKRSNRLRSNSFGFKLPDGNPASVTLLSTQGMAHAPTIVFAYPGASNWALNVQGTGHGSWGALNFENAIARGFAVALVDMPMEPEGVFGRGPVTDMLDALAKGLQPLQASQIADSQCMFLVGHSFGGFMVEAVISKMHAFRAAVSMAGISDPAAAYFGLGDTIANNYYRDGQGRMGKSLLDAPGRYLENSPILRVDRIRTPLLLLHGAKDRTVPAEQSVMMFRAMVEKDKSAKLIIDDTAEHIGSRWSALTLDWLQQQRDSHCGAFRHALSISSQELRSAPMDSD